MATSMKKEARSLNFSYVAFTVFVLMVFASIFVNAEPEPMERPTRPKEFQSNEELKKYLIDYIRYYDRYSPSRYGKRDVSDIPRLDRPWEIFRILLEARRQAQQQKLKERQHYEQLLLQDVERPKPTNFPELLAKLYDETQ
ncbi:uncharacterized protein [Prorops nasuta]|uniref:uncharacterized protein n=1 Tax=Prorops nasuta TaxID=863751 RepID=UPI0034CD9FC3